MPIQAFENPYITIEQAQAIVNILTHQCALIERRNTADRVDFPELYDADYMKGRTHSDTSAVLAGFQEDTNIPGITITKIQYGRIHCQPQLESESAVMQIYSSDSSLKTDEIKEKCATYNGDDSNKKFCVFRFRTSSKGHLTGVDLIQFDANANIISTETIYKYRARTLRVSA